MNDNLTPEMNEEEEFIYLTDEEGNEYPFELLDVVTVNDEDYAVFFPAAEQEDDEETEVVILKVIAHEDGSAEFESTDDTDTLDKVYDIFMEHLRMAMEEDEHDHDCGCEECGGHHHE